MMKDVTDVTKRPKCDLRELRMVIRRLPFKYLDLPATYLPEKFGEDDLNVPIEEKEDVLMKIPIPVPVSPERQEQNDDKNQTSNKLSESMLTANQKSFKCAQCHYMTKDADLMEKHIHSAHVKRSICSFTSATKTSSIKQVAHHELDEPKRKKRTGTCAGLYQMSSNSSKYDKLSEKSISSIKVEEIPDCDKSKDSFDHVATDDVISSECPILNPTSSYNVLSEKPSNHNVSSAKFSNHNIPSNKSSTNNVISKASYKCTACNFDFNSENKLRRHTSIVHKKFCSNFSTQPYGLKANDERRHFKCYLCNTTCDSKQSMKNHFYVVHKLGVKKDETKPKLSRPMSSLSYIKAKSILPRNDLKPLLDENCFQCNLCDLRLKNQKWLDTHLASFHKLFSKYKCSRCDKKFDSKNLLTLHTACVHMSTENATLKLFRCSNCSTSFNNKILLLRHQKLACTHCSFKCSICFELFNDQQSLTRHIDSNHKDLQTFKSNFCSFEFATESQQIASVVKEDHCGNIYKCNHCSMTSTWSKRVYNHVHAFNNKFL